MSEETKTIDSERITQILKDCLFKEEELAGTDPANGKLPEHCVVVEGVMHKMGFHGERLKSHEVEVKEMLALLPDDYRKTGGGGMSFLNMCMDRNGVQWTSFHEKQNELLMLGIGLGIAGYCVPREMWTVLPGGMPYVWVDL